MAKSSRGGKRGLSAGGAGAAGVAVAGVDDANVQIDNSVPAQAMSAEYSQFMSMTDDEKADYISNTASQPVPVFLENNAFQRFTYNSKMNDKPQLVDDATLDTMSGTELFRTVNNGYDSRTDIGYTADQIAAQVQKGSVTRVSGDYSSVYGRGIYFADDYTGSAYGYGNTSGNVQKTAVIRCKLNSNAKVINHSTAQNQLRAEINSGSKLGNALAKIQYRDSESAVSLFALSKGYNVITSGHGYFNVLNRNAVTMSKDVKARGQRWK